MSKFCTKCGSQLPDEARFCTECGGAVKVKAAPQQRPAAGETRKDAQPKRPQEVKMQKPAQSKKDGEAEKKKSSKKWIISGAAAVLVAGIAVGVLFLTGVIGKSEDEDIQLSMYTIDYYRENSELLNVIDAKTSADNVTETDAASEFKERGFDQYPLEYNYTIDGEYLDDNEVSEASKDKHPMYYTYFTSESGEIWTVYLINGNISAYPTSYNMEADLKAELIVSESKNLMSYDAAENRFYETIPFDSAAVVKVVDRIDAETLNKLTLEEVLK